MVFPPAGSANPKALLKQAIDLQRKGQLQQAEPLVRQVLGMDPQNHAAMNILGVIAMQAGHPADAAKLFSQAIQLHAQDPEYHCNLGVVLLSQNRVQDGAAALDVALKLRPSHPMANFNLGLRALQTQDFEKADKHLAKAVKKMPNHPGALNAHGVSLSKLGKAGKAVTLFKKALKVQPNFGEAHFNLAGVLTEMGKFDEALPIFETLLKNAKPSPQFHTNYAIALQKSGASTRAVEHYEHALKLAPDFGDALFNFARLRMGQGLHEQALPLFEKAFAQRPADSEIVTNIIKAHQNKGDFDMARKVAKDFMAAHGDHAFVLLMLTKDKAFDFTDIHMAVLTDAANANTEDAALFHFALSEIRHRQKNFDDAFAHLSKGNALLDQSIRWTEKDERQLFDAIKSAFTRDVIEHLAVAGSDSDAPVFIVGMPRSATTLVEQIISSHPDAEGAGELEDVVDFATTLEQSPGGLASLTPEQVADFADGHLERLRAIAPDKARYSDKMPDNYRYLGLIAAAFPNAKIIHCKRDPMATCFSIFQQKFSGSHVYAYDLEKLGRRYRSYEDLMAFWKDVLPLDILDVQYEDLIADFEPRARQILDFCGLDWTDAVLDFHKTERKVLTASQWQVRQPIYTTSVEGWRAYEGHLEPLKAQLTIR
ncbi:sulfotransferase [Magnetovibrio sp. PR-2]|uniref:tetratricopeptide repeat-containing sulfotransferase family protein n=1 Tax=Magnetovibrio sp. PR-2 TaxID=3120356 RepID=UPI002FCDFA23